MRVGWSWVYFYHWVYRCRSTVTFSLYAAPAHTPTGDDGFWACMWRNPEAGAAVALTVRNSYDGPVWILAASGDLDLATAGTFTRQAVPAPGHQPERLILDLGELSFLDCAGARALAAAAQRAVTAGCPVVVRSLHPAAARMLALTGWSLPLLASSAPRSAMNLVRTNHSAGRHRR